MNTNPIPTNITNTIPINAFKMENRSTINDKQPTVPPIFPRKNKILQLHKTNIELKKPLKSKIRSLLYRPQNKNK